MSLQNEKIELYLEQVKEAIYGLVECDDLIDSLRQQLYDYAEEHPNLSFEELFDIFGSSEEIAKNFLENTKELTPLHIAKKDTRSSY